MTGLLHIKYDSLIKIMRKLWNCYHWTCLVYILYYISWIFMAVLVAFMVINVTFNNISVLSWRLVLLVEETGGPGVNHRPVASHWQTLSHNVVHLAWSRFEITSSVVIGTDCIGSCKFKYYTVTAKTAPMDSYGVNIVWLLGFCHHCPDLIVCRYHSISLHTNLLSMGKVKALNL